MQTLLYCTRSPEVTLAYMCFWTFIHTHTHTQSSLYFQFQPFSLSTTPAEYAYVAMATASQQEGRWERGREGWSEVEKLSWGVRARNTERNSEAEREGRWRVKSEKEWGCWRVRAETRQIIKGRADIRERMRGQREDINTDGVLQRQRAFFKKKGSIQQKNTGFYFLVSFVHFSVKMMTLLQTWRLKL